MTDDAELLRRYAEEGDEQALAAWVRANLGLVYAAALRRLGGDAHAAADVAQQVFVAATRDAARLARHASVTGWLYAATRNAVLNLMRDEQRRKQRERAAGELAHADQAAGTAEWARLKPVLDAAMDELGDSDREAVLLRFFEGRAFAEVGRRLQVSENAARMRVERALEKLRARLAHRGVTSTAAALGLVLTQQAGAATVSVPAGLAGSVTSAALVGAETAGATGALVGFMSTKGIITAGGVLALGALLGTANWQSSAASAAEADLATAKAETAAMAARRETMARAVEAAEREAAEWATKAAETEAARAKAAETARTVATQPKNDPNWDPVAEGKALMERHPELRRSVVARSDAIANFTYGPLFRELGLNEAQQEAFRQAMRERGGISAPSGPRGETYSFPAGMNPSESGDAHLARLREIIGDSGVARLPEFQRLQEARSTAAKVAGALVFSDAPLAGDQAQRLAELMMNTARTPGSNRIGALDWDEIVRQAPAVLSGPQLEALATLRADEERRRTSARSAPASTAGGLGK
jgi:RNA polymerase sigma factor (sigma-70 family)